jgi:crotonobetainyl-CoA:carnitine CoA-transferase CaiB-like acyl-CoA transferase
MTAQTSRPLSGYRVVSLAEQYPGPFATLLLGDLGADVVQVERPAGGDPSRIFPGFYEALNRGKRSVALDLKHPDGLAACRALIERADVLLEGFRPGVMDRLGLSADTLAATNPGLVRVSVSGFGQFGPYHDRPAHDLTFQGLTGLLDAQSPAVPQLSLADLAAGLFTAIAALTGIAGRASGGRGGHYDVSMFDTLVSFIATKLVPAANGVPADTLGLDPGYGLFATADARWVSLSIAFEDHFWRALCLALELPELAEIPGPQRVERREELRTAVAQRIASKDLAHWEQSLHPVGIAYGAVQTLQDLLADQHVRARELLQTVDGRTFFRQPLWVDGGAPGPRSGAPQLGQHTVEVLGEAGLSAESVEQLLSSGAAAQPD